MEVHDKVVGPYFVDVEVDFFGEIDGNAYVRPHGILNLYGVLTGDLHVQAGGCATIHGIVTGFVENAGASVEVYGRVGGIHNHDRKYPTIVGYSAAIGAG
ncbi:MAG: hypothetical protein JO001_22050 [Alphaproteobacteria bacterium]|nr:hypothetical protein [Alphaproteobacteria bacterium]